MTFGLFRELDIETVNTCNRHCPTCLRNSTPQHLVTDRFGKLERLSFGVIADILQGAAELGYRGPVNFSHYNEPLQDRRIGVIGRYALRTVGVFSEVAIHTNGDLLDKRRAEWIDGNFDMLYIARYDDDSMSERARIQALVPNTPITWVPKQHIVTHFSPLPNLDRDIRSGRMQPCRRGVQRRMVISYKGDMLLCCEDLGAGFLPPLGNIHTTSLKNLWFDQAHQDILARLNAPGGRASYSYCWDCPRANEEND